MPESLTLAPYQLELVAHQLDRADSFGMVGCGLGKTAATLSTLSAQFLTGETRSALVVAPLRVATLTWPAEAQRWDVAAGVPVNVLRRPAAWRKLTDPGLHVINYDALPKLCAAVKELGRWPFGTVVFDESTRAKNPKSKRVNELRPLLKGARKRIALTGTPAPNSLMELFAQVRLLDDGAALGPNFEAFKRRYFYPTDYMEYNWAPQEGAEDAIRRRIAHLCIVQTTEEHLKIPETVVDDIEVSIPEGARSFYDTLERDLIARVKDTDVLGVNAAVLAGRLLQVASGAVYHDEGEEGDERPRHDLHRSKIAALESLRRQYKGEPILVACNFRHEQERLMALPGCVRFDSAGSDKAQRELVERWNEKQIPLLVADPRSIGHGLNLQHGGRVVVWFSPTYSRELYDQFNARLARRGQGERTFVHRLCARDTIDDAVLETLRVRGDAQAGLQDALRNLTKMRA